VFGNAEDKKGKVANTLLCVMVKCLFTKRKFLAKLIPCHALNADFAHQCISNVIVTLENCGATVIGLITDNNRVNQACFGKFSALNADTPWVVKSPGGNTTPFFLIYDPVHLLKNIRNNWITEKTKTLSFCLNNETHFACWRDLEDLQRQESSSIVKMSRLSAASVNPSNLEKQKVSLALNVFCDQTAAALKTSEHSTSAWVSTADFIQIVSKLWKLLNCKSAFQASRFNDPDRAVVDSVDEESGGFALLLNWAESKFLLKPEGTTRVRTLTKDTAAALTWSCSALADICKFLLLAEAPYRHNYVCLGFFQQDDLERHFGHFRMAAGGNFFMTTQEVFATHNIDKARFMLQWCENFDITDSHHLCELCQKPLTDTEHLLIDDMTHCRHTINHDEKLTLFYIGGYIAFKHHELRGEASDYRDEVSSYLEALNRSELRYPCVTFFDFILSAYIFFRVSKETMGRADILKLFLKLFDLDITIGDQPLRRLCNIFFK